MTTFDPQRHHRRSIRLKGYDYAQAGAYFVTICTQGRECLFGDVVNDRMRLNDAGQMMEATWLDLPNRFPNVELDEHVIMPNHMHGIIVIVTADVGVGLVPTPKATTDRATHDVGVGLVPTPKATTDRATHDVGVGLVPTPKATPDRATHDVGVGLVPTPTATPDRATHDVEAGLVPAPNAAAKGATTRVAPTNTVTPTTARPRLGDIVGTYKSIATNEYIAGVKQRGWPGFDRKLLQRNYYEHIIRNEHELNAIRQYIANNPLKWALDLDNPANWKRRALKDTADIVYLYLREAGL